MTKQEKFLWIVQTSVLANGINLSLDRETAIEKRHNISVTGISTLLSEAIRASEIIPDGMSAEDAAFEFCYYMLENLREEGTKLPHWFARY